MQDTLSTIQTVFNVGRILSKIVFIVSIVGTCLCVVGMISLALVPNGSFMVGEVTVHGFVSEAEALPTSNSLADVVSVLVFCVAELIMARLALNYFNEEQAAGTPFTFVLAKRMKNLGIAIVVISVVSSIVAAVAVFATIGITTYVGTTEVGLGDAGNIGIGIMFIVASLLCRHGAEVSSN